MRHAENAKGYHRDRHVEGLRPSLFFFLVFCLWSFFALRTDFRKTLSLSLSLHGYRRHRISEWSLFPSLSFVIVEIKYAIRLELTSDYRSGRSKLQNSIEPRSEQLDACAFFSHDNHTNNDETAEKRERERGRELRNPKRAHFLVCRSHES